MSRRAEGAARYKSVLLALTGGLLVAFAMPPWGFWPLAFIGVMMFETALGAYPTRRQRAGIGFAFGATWMFVGMAWMWFLTIPGYIVAACLFAGLHGLAAMVAPTGAWRAIGRPAAHTLVEAIRFIFPFSGVPLASLGISQAGGPLLGLARVGGVLLITWVVFQIGFAMAGPSPAIPKMVARRRTTATGHPHGVVALAAIVVLFVLAAVAPEGHNTSDAPLTIAAVQGGGQQGTSALEVHPDDVTLAHLDATAAIEPDDDLDLVVWPENSIDVDNEPFIDSWEYEAVAAEARRLGVSFAVGITEDSEYSSYPVDGSFVNAEVIVAPNGDIVSRYEKRIRVPFGEYVPMRGLLETLGAPLDRVRSDATSGRDPARIMMPDGTNLGVMISWEVFFGSRGRDASGGDAVIMLNPTNGASYSTTILQTQQVASSLLRATETGRWVVQVSPTGFSAFVSPDGKVFDRTDTSEQVVITKAIPQRAGTTWYSTLGDWPWIGLGILLLLAALWFGEFQPRRKNDEPQQSETATSPTSE